MIKKGKLIVFEGGDASGKETQSRILAAKLSEKNLPVKQVSFPNYRSDSSALIKMYLNGEFGDDPAAINPYAASLFYTVDRYASYKTDWEAFYGGGGIVVADRYVTSNMIHQGAKIRDPVLRKQYLEWLWQLEIELVGLPAPDIVFFLDVPPAYSRALMADREKNSGGQERRDIHEASRTHLDDVYRLALEIAEAYRWVRIQCVRANQLRSIEDIHSEIYKHVEPILVDAR